MAVHGDKGQREREEAVNAFKAGTTPVSSWLGQRWGGEGRVGCGMG